MGKIRNIQKSKEEKQGQEEETLRIKKETLRIANNTVKLLSQGIFSGVSAPALAETQEWVAGIVLQVEADLQVEVKDGDKKEPTQFEG